MTNYILNLFRVRLTWDIMKLILAVLTLLLAVSSISPLPNFRHLWTFKNMVEMVTKRNAWDYNNYGNYCGRGGHDEPVDEIDRCCQLHDQCYYTLNRAECKIKYLPWLKLGVYMTPYDWTFEDGQVVCAPDQPECNLLVCECDKNCVVCFAEHEADYNGKNKKGWLDWIKN